MRSAVALVGLLTLSVPVAGQSFSAGTAVDRASRYAATFVSRFSRVVAEERYVQDSNPNSTVRRPAQHQESAADFLLVRADDQSGWMTFRDVFEVNHAVVHDRSERLSKLFLDSPETAVSRAQAISQEGARYNIGPRRTINNPLLPLALLQDMYRSRFSFELKGTDRVDGVEAWILEYQETASPTLIRGASNRDVQAKGRYWIDERTGSVLKAELTADDQAQTARITVTFRPDDRFSVRMPVQMDEVYGTREGIVLRATARYDRFREFSVTTNEVAR